MQIAFTGLTIDSRDLEDQFCSDWRYPVDWERIIVTDISPLASDKMREFASKHLLGRYTYFSNFDDAGYCTVVLFEQLNDAIMFKMLDGGKQCFDEC